MKGFKTVPPKQRYMTLAEIHEAYGSRGVVAYSCKVVDVVPEGGFVIAVQDTTAADNSGLKEYQRQLIKQYPAKAPIYYLHMESANNGQRYTLYYDNGVGEKKAITKIEVKKSDAEEAIERIPDELLARALITAFKTDETGGKK